MNKLSIPVATLLIIVGCFPAAEAADFDTPQAPGDVTSPIRIPDLPKPKIDYRKLAYVDRLIIEVGPAIQLPFPQRLPSEKLDALSMLAGVRLRGGANMHFGIHRVHLPKKITVPEAEALCEKILADPDIKSCGPPLKVQLQGGSSPPSDPLYQDGSQWSLMGSAGSINMVPAWAITTGSNDNVIAVIDTGVTSHPDLQESRVLTSAGYNFVSDPIYGGPRSPGGGDPGSWVTSPEGVFWGCPTRSDWHGTAVTGVIGASANNGMIAGVDWVSRILPIRAFGKCHLADTDDLIDAMIWASGESVDVPAEQTTNPAKIINLSFAGYGTPCAAVPGLQSTITGLGNLGVVTIVSAGNDDGVDASQNYPGSCNGVITVGSTTKEGGKGTFSSGARVDISAPGAGRTSEDAQKVLVLWNTGWQGPSTGSTALGWGTSIAAPHVTGVVSLMRSVRPEMPPAQVRDILRKTARPFPTGVANPCTTSTCGAGILDAGKAVAAAKATTAGGTGHNVTLKADGTVWTWGYNGNGQLGSGPTGVTVTAPIPVTGVANVIAVSAGNYRTVAAKSDGTVWSWGYNFSGEIGNGTTVDQPIPVQATGLTGIVQVAAGDGHTLALKSDGTVWSWGYNFFGQLGAGPFDFDDRTTPVQVLGLSNVKAVAAGGKGSMALKADGTVWVWGDYKSILPSVPDWYSTGGASGPYLVPGLSGIVAISAAEDASTPADIDVLLALTGDGRPYTWGYNNFGELGQGNLVSSGLPLLVSALSGRIITSMATSGRHVVALADDGTQWAWGLGYNGQLGDGVSGLEPGQSYWHFSATPIQAASGLTNAVDVAVGSAHSVVMKADLTISAWGANDQGQLGNGSTTDAVVPVQVQGADHSGVFNLLNSSSSKTDIQITITNTPNPTQVGQNATYNITVANLGTSSASNVVANMVVPTGAVFSSASAGCTFNTIDGSVTCAIGALGAGGNVNLQVVVQFLAPGIYSASAIVRSDATDSNPLNNVAGNNVAVSSVLTLDFIEGWNLVGNSSTSVLTVATVFGDTSKVLTVWTWVSPDSRWAFYTPLLVGQALIDYCASNGYDVLTTIKDGEGFWVNAVSPFSVQINEIGMVDSSAFRKGEPKAPLPGWNLIAIGDNITPSAFNKAISDVPLAAGDIPLNVITLWAWDAYQGNWYFYAPSLERSGELQSYIASHGYLDFGTNTLTPSTGIWLNMP